jgi:hypothetical protein
MIRALELITTLDAESMYTLINVPGNSSILNGVLIIFVD